MRRISFVLFAIIVLSSIATAQQRIEFTNGTATVAGSLSNGQVRHFVFSASQGQTVTIKNSTSSIFDFRVYNEVFFDEGDYDSSASYYFEAPETGDYMFTVRKKIAGPRTARFSMTIKIK